MAYKGLVTRHLHDSEEINVKNETAESPQFCRTEMKQTKIYRLTRNYTGKVVIDLL